jgi:hypothetical protein
LAAALDPLRVRPPGPSRLGAAALVTGQGLPGPGSILAWGVGGFRRPGRRGC